MLLLIFFTNQNEIANLNKNQGEVLRDFAQIRKDYESTPGH
jgi:hypothetical protein